jgi:hypothetical protein
LLAGGDCPGDHAGRFSTAYEVTEGNSSVRATLRGFLGKIGSTYGKVRRECVMDRGIPTQEVNEGMCNPDRGICYPVGTPRGKIHQCEKKWLELPWRKVREQ